MSDDKSGRTEGKVSINEGSVKGGGVIPTNSAPRPKWTPEKPTQSAPKINPSNKPQK